MTVQLSTRTITASSAALCTALLLRADFSIAEEDSSSNDGMPGIVFALPVEIDADNGAANGDATIIRFLPLYTLPRMDHWKLIHLNLITLADTPGGIPGTPGNPDPVDGDRVFGLGDLVHASFYTPDRRGNFIWGAGLMLSFPTATSELLGSGKWSAGPSFRLVYRTELWNVGVIGAQQWSYAGDSDRNDVSQLMLRGTIARDLSNDWFFVSAPIITANWNAHGQKWLVPLGGGIGRKFEISSNPWAWTVQGYYNIIKPDGAPNWSVRLSIIAAIPLP